MAYYTTTMAEIYDNNHDFAAIARDIFSTFDYPIYDDSFKNELETDFVREFYMDEIAHETFQMWLWRLSVVWNDTIPKYNLMWRELNRLLDIGTDELFGSGRTESYHSEDIGENTQHSHIEGTDDSENTPNITDTANVAMDNAAMPLTAETDITSYRTEAQKTVSSNVRSGTDTTTSTSEQTGSSEGNTYSTSSYTRKINGNAVDDHNYSLLIEFREQWIDIQKAFFNELRSQLFMQIVYM